MIHNSTCAADCIFTDWVGLRSPLMSMHESVTHIRNSVFRNTTLAVELVDVSHGGIVRFNDVSLADVSLTHGAVVSTTTNDYYFEGDVLYYASDDAQYDVPLEPVPSTAQSMFGEDFVIADATMSDCLFLRAQEGDVFPGCPEESVAARQRLVRSWNPEPGSLDPTGAAGPPVKGDLWMSTLLIEPDDSWFVEVQSVRTLLGVSVRAHALRFHPCRNQHRRKRQSSRCMCRMQGGTRWPMMRMHVTPLRSRARSSARAVDAATAAYVRWASRL